MTLDELLIAVIELAEMDRGLIVDRSLRVFAAAGFEQDELATLHTDDPYNLLRKALLDGFQRNEPVITDNAAYLPPFDSITGFKLRMIGMIPFRQGAYLLYCDHNRLGGKHVPFEQFVAFVRAAEPNLVHCER